MKTEAEVLFEKFASGGYIVSSVDDEDIYSILLEFAVHLVPIDGVPTWIEQDRRRRQWPWVMADLGSRLVAQVWDLKGRNKRLQEDLIEARKEISRLKREK